MSVSERRKRTREENAQQVPAFIEIRHTFGPIRKSIYKVLEYNEYGTSFLIPTTDGFFPSGTPIEYSIVADGADKKEKYGTVRYFHPYNDQAGTAYYKIGVENNPLITKQPGKLRIRPERLRVAELASEHAIFFTIEGVEYEFPLIDISRYSAAFHCDEEHAFSFSVSTAIDLTEITFGTKTIFEGTIVITRRDIDGERYRIVVEPRNAIFDLDIIEEQETLTTVARSVDTLVSESEKYGNIDSKFKAVVADMRLFLDGYRQILDMPAANKLAMDTDQVEFLDELNKTFYPKLDSYWAELENVITRLVLNENDQGLYRSYAQEHLHSVLMASPICHRIYFKPLGYPGDYEMMRMIAENRYDGPTLFSKLVNKHALGNPLAAANRNRINILADRIVEFVRECDEPIVRLLSLASGPALEIQRIIDVYPEIANRIHVTLLDQEREALRYSQDCIYMKRIIKNSNIQVDLVHQNIGGFLKQAARGSVEMPQFDMLYIFGLFDYFDERACSFCMNKSSSLVKDDGKMIVSNYSLDGHHHRTFMEYAFEWFMIYRDRDQMQALGQSLTRPCTTRVHEDPTGVIKFLEVTFRREN